jgi:hypothetical protein
MEEPTDAYVGSFSTTGHIDYGNGDSDSSGSLGGFALWVHDCAGNKQQQRMAADLVRLVQDVGPTLGSGWSRTTCACAIGGSMLRTSTKNVSLTIKASGAGKHLAVVMAKGPARGKAAIYYDGAYVKTIDTYASVNTNRVVMWDKAMSGTSTHTVKVVNLATSGRPRIDVDALLSQW